MRWSDMAVDSARFSTYSRDDAAAAGRAAAVAAAAAAGGSSRASRVRSSTDPEKYAVYAAMRNDASAPPLRLGLLPSRERENALPAAAALEATERGGDDGLSPDSNDLCAASFSGFALRRASARQDEPTASAAAALHRARRVADVRIADRPYIYDIIEDQPDAAVYDRIYTKHMLVGSRRTDEAAAFGERAGGGGGGSGGSGLPKPPIRRVASERRAPPAAAETGVDDDYGFLCYNNNKPDAAVAEIMQKDPSSSKRFFNKKKRNTKSTSRQPSISGSVWCYEDKGKWMNDAGVSLTLEEPTRVVNLSEKEYSILQKICLVRLQSMEIGCPVTIPKGDTKRKRFGLKKKRSNTINLGHLLEHLKESTKRDKEEPPQSSGWVFAIPLSRALTNDTIWKRRRSSLLREMSDSGNLSSPSCHGTEPSAESSQNSLLDDNKEEEEAPARDARVSPAVNDGTDKEALLPHKAVIPHFVATCFRYIEKYGLNVLGIFRVCSSKTRIKQLHDEFDSGREVKLDEEHNPHDVAALLKEYFRELPEPLLCKDLYEPFLATRAINDPQKRLTALRYVIFLLPTPNRDLLYSLLKFLVNVHNHSNDTCDGRGNVLAGNKMDSFNLATLFGPNVLRKVKTSNDLDQPDFAEKTRDVIHVVKEMIDNCEALFSVPVELQDEVLKTLVETDQESANFILSYRLDGKEECRADVGSVHSSCSSVTAAGHHAPPPESGLSKSASSPAPFLQGSPGTPPYPSRMATSTTSKDSASFDMGNYVELRSPRLTLTLPQLTDGHSIGGSEKESPSSPFYVATSLPGSPQMCAGNRPAAQLGPWLAYPVSPRPNSYSSSRPGRDAEQQLPQSGSRYLTPGAPRTGGRRESAPSGATSKHRPLSVTQRGDGGGGDFGEGPETLV